MGSSNPKVFDGDLPLGDKVFVGIDPSYTGFAMTLLSATGPAYKTYVYKLPHTGIQRLANLGPWMDGILDQYEVVDVAIESPVRLSNAALMMGELFGLTRYFLARRKLYPLQVPPMSLKKYITGKGTGVQKNQILLQVYKKWIVEFTDDNAADSFGLAHMARGDANNAYETEVLDKLDDPKFRDLSEDIN